MTLSYKNNSVALCVCESVYLTGIKKLLEVCKFLQIPGRHFPLINSDSATGMYFSFSKTLKTNLIIAFIYFWISHYLNPKNTWLSFSHFFPLQLGSHATLLERFTQTTTENGTNIDIPLIPLLMFTLEYCYLSKHVFHLFVSLLDVYFHYDVCYYSSLASLATQW